MLASSKDSSDNKAASYKIDGSRKLNTLKLKTLTVRQASKAGGKFSASIELNKSYGLDVWKNQIGISKAKVSRV